MVTCFTFFILFIFICLLSIEYGGQGRVSPTSHPRLHRRTVSTVNQRIGIDGDGQRRCGVDCLSRRRGAAATAPHGRVQFPVTGTMRQVQQIPARTTPPRTHLSLYVSFYLVCNSCTHYNRFTSFYFRIVIAACGLIAHRTCSATGLPACLQGLPERAHRLHNRTGSSNTQLLVIYNIRRRRRSDRLAGEIVLELNWRYLLSDLQCLALVFVDCRRAVRRAQRRLWFCGSYRKLNSVQLPHPVSISIVSTGRPLPVLRL